eukprot:scaffold250190_cov27-Tisochrysis_lutea.AAC.1
MTPRKPSREMAPRCRSPMATSQGCSPAVYKAAAISRSPFEPSWRSTATRGRVSEGSDAVSLGVKLSCQPGACRDARPACSCATHAGAAWSFSSSKEVASHSSRSAPKSASTTWVPFTFTYTGEARGAVWPMREHGTPAFLYAVSTAASSAPETSSTSPTSSANRAAKAPCAVSFA